MDNTRAHTHTHTEFAEFRCTCRLNPSGIDLMLLACVTIPKSVGHFLLDSDKIMIGQTYGLNDDTQQLNLNGCAEV